MVNPIDRMDESGIDIQPDLCYKNKLSYIHDTRRLKEESVMTATGEILNLPVAIPTRTLPSSFSLPQRRCAARYIRPHRVYSLPNRQQSNTFRYGADGYTKAAPDKGNIIDLFA